MICPECKVERVIEVQKTYPDWIFSVCPQCGRKFATENSLMKNFNIKDK